MCNIKRVSYISMFLSILKHRVAYKKLYKSKEQLSIKFEHKSKQVRKVVHTSKNIYIHVVSSVKNLTFE